MEELLMCSVCIERYHESKRQPVLLPRCGHSFCRPCVSMLVSGGCIVCPTCRADQRIDFVERLPTEYTLLAIIHAQENNKKETCERHFVKLSFWCRTCEKATCGECLFEDHPTHSHDVIRASKYITDMKQSAQDVAIKFIEVLDEREQTYYKIIFHCTKRISSAIRSIGVLRKDMEEARELMKGIKEEESISAATSLSEAAKFLGLKWNIQDANYHRNIKDEKIKDEIDIEKEKAQEADAKQQKELKEQEEKKRERAKERELKRVLRKSKTLSSVDMIKELQQIAATKNSENKTKLVTANIENNESQKTTEKPTENETKTDEFKPKETEKQEESKANGTSIDVKSKSDDTKPQPEESKSKPEESKLKPEETKSKLEETKPKPVVKHEEITINDIIKRKEQLKKPDDIINNDDLKHSQFKIPDLNSLKSKAKIPRIKPLIKKPSPPSTPIEEKAHAENLEVIPESEAELAKSATLNENDKKEASNKEPTTLTSEIETKEDKDIKEKATNGLSQDEDKDSSEDEVEEDIQNEKEPEDKEVTASNAVSSDSGLSEHSRENKRKDPFDDFLTEGKLTDFIQVPGFMLCVEAEDGRLSSIEWGPQGLHIHCLQFTHVTYDIVLRDTILNAIIPSKSPIVFLELTADQTILGRVYIKLWGHLRRAHNFLSLCLGDQGKSYMNTKFLQVYNVNNSGERILGGDYEHNNGRGGRGLLDDMEWNSDYAMPMKAGMITAAGSGQSATNSLFLICTQCDPSRNFSCPFGMVYEGLKVVKDAVQQTATKQVWITDCGVLITPPKFEA